MWRRRPGGELHTIGFCAGTQSVLSQARSTEGLVPSSSCVRYQADQCRYLDLYVRLVAMDRPKTVSQYSVRRRERNRYRVCSLS